MTIIEIKNLCQQLGIRPSKAMGQNFLIDEQALAKIVSAGELKKTDLVIEIGPGFGVLTEKLISNCRKVLCVELDKRLVFYLHKKFKQAGNLEILQADILKIKNQELAVRLGGGEYKLVANLPYAITKPIIRKFLSYEPRPKSLTILVQKEVAEKIIAKPGEMSLLSLSVQFYGQPEIANLILKQSFFPIPKVDSAILKITVNRDTLPAEISQVLSEKERQDFQEKRFWQLVKIGFSSPRKQLHNNLASGYKLDNLEAKDRLVKIGLRADCRAQNLSLKDWAGLYQQFVV
ncbi:MAG: 16S rRNA (adenine(1518)-N(6)/adenine(1519)-N(6))-dimethyltransferase RsmA [Candidatus Parcubacteria bacterium]|nr:16S rRNA (adenine(1518)-N(6)/adenine(1519)-N(6))-dimethyltransferase RsmA [Candidatus Parcubacteria bacterium]